MKECPDCNRVRGGDCGKHMVITPPGSIWESGPSVEREKVEEISKKLDRIIWLLERIKDYTGRSAI